MILGLVDHNRGKLDELSLEMLTLARRLAGQTGQPLHAVLVGAEAEPLAARLGEYGVAAVHVVQHPRLDEYAPEAWARSLQGLMQSLGAQAVLAPGSDRGHEVMAHLAALADLPLAANVTDVQPGEAYLVTRLRWGGSLLEEARLKGGVKLLTVAPHVVAAEPAPNGEAPAVHTVTSELSDKDFRVRVTARVPPAAGKVSLGEARVVVSGGRGVGSAEGFAILEELAGLLNGAVGCSRAVTSLGWRSHHDQIGQTGVRIAPDIYIACGVSGAIQHMVGAKGAKHILAINNDPEAPIVAQADYAIIGDLHQVVPALTAAIRQARGG